MLSAIGNIKSLLLIGIILSVLIGVSEIQIAFGIPTITSAVWDDADNGDTVLSEGDTLTITFSSATNRPGGTGTIPKGIIDNLFTFSNSIGTDYNAVWTSNIVFTITILDATGATALIGDNVSAKGTMQFVGTLDTTGGTPFVSPNAIGINSTNFIFVGDDSNNLAQIFNPDGTFAGTIDTTGGTAFSAIDDIAINDLGTVYVSDRTNNNVQTFTSGGTFVSTFNDNIENFQNPEQIAINSTRSVFVTDALPDNVLIFSQNGVYDERIHFTLNSNFDRPSAVAINSTNQIFVAYNNDKFQIFSPSNVFISSLDITGALFTSPQSMAFNSTDYLFISDSGRDTVQIFSPSGTFAGEIDLISGNFISVNADQIAINNNDDVYMTDTFRQQVAIYTQGIRDSTSPSLPVTGGLTTAGDFGISITPCSPTGGNWMVDSSCTMTGDATVAGNIIVSNGVVLTVPNGITLTIPSGSNITILSGGGLLIEFGGTVIIVS